jgi:hypothetical protein
VVKHGILRDLPGIGNRRTPRPRADQFFSSFNPEPAATVINREKNAVAVGSGLNERYPMLKN